MKWKFFMGFWLSLATAVVPSSILAYSISASAEAALLTGDWNQIHTNVEYCKNTMFGQRIAHGLLVLSISTGLADRLGFMEETIQAFMGLDWKLRAPVFIGDTIRLRATVKKKREMRRLNGGLVTFDVQILKQDDAVVQKGTWQALMESEAADE